MHCPYILRVYARAFWHQGFPHNAGGPERAARGFSSPRAERPGRTKEGTTVMRDVKTIAIAQERDARMAVAATSFVLLVLVVLLIPSLAGAAAPV